MAKIFFTADTHFNDPRLDIYFRPFKNVEEMNKAIVDNWNKTVSKEDTVWHLGDFSKDKEGYSFVSKLNGKINLILGNYDEKGLGDYSIFNSVQKNSIVTIGGMSYFLTHKPEDYNPAMFNLVGHIHGLWRVQRNMINVGTDAWHFLPISEEQIQATYAAIKKHYDKNVFMGEFIKTGKLLEEKKNITKKASRKLKEK